MSDFQALSVLLTLESFMLAVISLIASLGDPERKRIANFDIAPHGLAYGVAAIVVLSASGAAAAWCGIFASGGEWRTGREIWIAGVLLIAIVTQPVLAVVIARGLRTRI